MKRTIKELETILEKERKSAPNDGMFGLDECKKEIKRQMEWGHKTIHQVYCDLIVRGLSDKFFNTFMIVAAEQMMEEAE